MQSEFDSLCDELLSRTERKLCRKQVKRKAKNAEAAVERAAKEASSDADRERSFLKDRKKQRESDASEILDDYEDVLDDLFGNRNRDLERGKLDAIELIDAQEIVLEERALFLRRCKSEMVGGVSGACTGQVQKMTREVLPLIEKELKKARARIRKDENDDDDE